METPPTQKFAIGDVVQLNSGGPLMTVIEINPHNGDISLRWSLKDGGMDFVDCVNPLCLKLPDKLTFTELPPLETL